MKTVQKDFLFARILEESENRIHELRAESVERIQDINRERDKKIEEMIDRFSQKKAKAVERLEKNLHSNFKVESRRAQLLQQELLVQKILIQIQKDMKERIGNPQYPQVLSNWICEGVLIVSRSLIDGVIVRTSTEEIFLITDSLLQGVSQRIVELTSADHRVSFVVDRNNFIPDQGVVVLSQDKRILFSNTLSSQLMRRDSEIRSCVFDLLLKTFS